MTFCLLLEFAGAATIRGSVYDAQLELVDKAIVTINSTPRQREVAENAFYTFEVPEGDYELTAAYSKNGELFSSSEKISVRSEDGDYEIDLIIETLSLSFSKPSSEEFNEAKLLEFPEQTQIPPLARQSPDYSWMLPVVFVFVVALLPWAWLRGRRRIEEKIALEEKQLTRELKRQPGEVEALEKKAGETRETEKINKIEIEKKDGGTLVLTRGQRELLRKIKESGGRTTQKELRKSVACSEAKVSLDLDVLEAQGLIRKFKKGRGNIIVLVKNA
ncbi:MAG: hypothetical protein QW343_01175 [Candidatus Norongarragalinales archaeon]